MEGEGVVVWAKDISSTSFSSSPLPELLTGWDSLVDNSTFTNCLVDSVSSSVSKWSTKTKLEDKVLEFELDFVSVLIYSSGVATLLSTILQSEKIVPIRRWKKSKTLKQCSQNCNAKIMFLTKGKSLQQTLCKETHQLSPPLITPQSYTLLLLKTPATKIINNTSFVLVFC